MPLTVSGPSPSLPSVIVRLRVVPDGTLPKVRSARIVRIRAWTVIVAVVESAGVPKPFDTRTQ